MADRATAASTAAAATVEQKYYSAVNILRTDIDRAKSAQAKAGGEASQAYTRIEKLGVNKKAATFIASLIKTERVMQEDVLRSVINLATAAGMMPKEDLVDLADRLEDEGATLNAGGDDESDDDGSDDDAPDDEDDGRGDESAPAVKADSASQKEWDAAGEAAAAKAKVGDRKSPAEARAERKANLRSVPDAIGGGATTH